ncbi:hypothetical protein HOP50_11g62070 [Chloropicon primus]|uniref:WD40 repeat domain-containing protein n=1 Tax=Chloropicon primus TaxID=1764295 RepID=A0A5B8MTK8_9CHLO|nr:hypothetical protein A3770_11p61850 [Chloropicon primus]UPR02880.1 hypothetical protein HOP50_11g62070 [Chloropicon primus]|eukprot:QDZ23667.1 hypothetical protein A3770_11p61850 [Chloropicon primus]
MIAEDPDNLVDILPQPYRMLDKIVAQVVEGAIEECLEREKADKVYGLSERESAKTLELGEGCSCYATTSDSKQAAAGYKSGKVTLFDMDDGSQVLSQDLESGEIQAIVCYTGDNGEELFCVYTYGSLALYKIIQVEREVEAEVDAGAGAKDGEEGEAAEEGGEPTTIMKKFPEFEKVSQTHVREPESEQTKFELKLSPNRRFISLFVVDAEAEISFYEVSTVEKEPEKTEEGEEGAEGEEKEGATSSEAEAEERPPTYAHELVDAGTFDKSSSESFFEQSLSNLCYAWVCDAAGVDVGILVWNEDGTILVFKQLCKEFTGSISTVEGKNSTWSLPFPISCVAFDAESDLLLIGSKKGFVSLWNMFYRDHLSFLHKDCYPTAMKVTRKGGRDGLAISCTASDRSMSVYDVDSKKISKRIILPFVASNIDVDNTKSKRRWILHGTTSGDEEEPSELVSVLDLDEFKPAGADIRLGATANLVFTVEKSLCAVMRTHAAAGDEKKEGNEEERASTSSLDLYSLEPESGAGESPDSAPADLASDVLMEKSLVFKSLTEHIQQGGFDHMDEELERKALLDIRKHLVNLDIHVTTTAFS